VKEYIFIIKINFIFHYIFKNTITPTPQKHLASELFVKDLFHSLFSIKSSREFKTFKFGLFNIIFYYICLWGNLILHKISNVLQQIFNYCHHIPSRNVSLLVQTWKSWRNDVKLPRLFHFSWKLSCNKVKLIKLSYKEIKENKRSEITISQCFFTLPNNSRELFILNNEWNKSLTNNSDAKCFWGGGGMDYVKKSKLESLEEMT
jgi:hypothetical protein